MKKVAIIILCISAALATASCRQSKSKSVEVVDNKVDVLYIVSTNVLVAYDDEGKEVYQARLTDDDKAIMDAEANYVKENFFGEDFNFIAPYYHQFTFNALKLPKEEFNTVYSKVAEEVCEIFDEYMANENCGRRFILAGFSQGAMLLTDLLKHMSDEQYSRMVAAYELGYRLSEKDLECAHIRPAESATDNGVVISFNSVMNEDAIWNVVSESSVTCINPINWTTDVTPATLYFDGDTATVSVDPVNNVLMVEGLDPEKYNWGVESLGFPVGNLHHYDILFYCDNIRENALLRAYGE